MSTFPLPTLGPTLAATGITAPPYADIYQSLQETFRNIYGTDAYINPDSQDGQLLAVFAQAVHDGNSACVLAFNSFSPAKAIGVALSSNVKINGIERQSPSRSTVALAVVGVVGTIIVNGLVEDALGVRWSLPASVLIPLAGTITVIATCQTEGAIEAGPNTVNIIATPTLGWQTVTNPASAAIGNPVELDAQLRVRQTLAVMKNALTVLEAMQASILNLPGVQKSHVYENDTDADDSNGLPEHSIAAVVYGGDPDEIAATIKAKKTPGADTYGTTTVPITDALGNVTNISFFVVTLVDVVVEVQIKARAGYATSTAENIKEAVAAYINSLDIGQRVDQGRVYLPAQLYGATPEFLTYEVNSILLTASGGSPTDADLDMEFNELARCLAENVEVVVTP